MVVPRSSKGGGILSPRLFHQSPASSTASLTMHISVFPATTSHNQFHSGILALSTQIRLPSTKVTTTKPSISYQNPVFFLTKCSRILLFLLIYLQWHANCRILLFFLRNSGGIWIFSLILSTLQCRLDFWVGLPVSR